MNSFFVYVKNVKRQKIYKDYIFKCWFRVQVVVFVSLVWTIMRVYIMAQYKARYTIATS